MYRTCRQHHPVCASISVCKSLRFYRYRRVKVSAPGVDRCRWNLGTLGKLFALCVGGPAKTDQTIWSTRPVYISYTRLLYLIQLHSEFEGTKWFIHIETFHSYRLSENRFNSHTDSNIRQPGLAARAWGVRATVRLRLGARPCLFVGAHTTRIQ